MAHCNNDEWDDSGADVHVKLRPGDTYRHGDIDYAHDGLPINKTRDKDSESRSHTRPEARGGTSRPSEAPRRPISERQVTAQASRRLREESLDRDPPRPRYTEEDELQEYYAARSARDRAASDNRTRQPFSSRPRDTNVSRRHQYSSSPSRNRNVSRRRNPFSSTPRYRNYSRPREPFALDAFDLLCGTRDHEGREPFAEDEFDRRFGTRNREPFAEDEFDRRFGTRDHAGWDEDDFDRRFPEDRLEDGRYDAGDPCPDPSAHNGRHGVCFARRRAGYPG